MQPFHVKQIWMKKPVVSEGKAKTIEANEEGGPSSPELLKVEPLPSWEDMLPPSLEMLRHISIKKKKDYPENP